MKDDYKRGRHLLTLLGEDLKPGKQMKEEKREKHTNFNDHTALLLIN